MKMVLNMKLDTSKQSNSRDVLNKERDKQFQPSWEQVWFSGYTKPTGTKKVGIFQSKLTSPDKVRLEAVKEAVETGVIGTQVDNLKQFTKSHALKLHKVLAEVTKEQNIAQIVGECPDNYHCVQTIEEMTAMLSIFIKEDFIGLDTETTGLDPFNTDEIVGMSISFPKADQHFYIPVRHNVEDFQLDANSVFLILKPFLEDERLGKVLHNAKFDAHMLHREGVVLKGIIMDTMVSMHVLNENEPSYALKRLATKWGSHFGFEDKSATYEELFGRGGFQDTPLDIATVYACKDTHLVVNFYKWIMGHLEKQPRLLEIHQLETEVLKVVIAMGQAGFMVDLDFAKDYQEVLVETLAQMEEELKEHFGDINLNSPDQLKTKLYKDLKLTDHNKGSVDAQTLKLLEKEHEGVSKLLKYREVNKLLTTYFEPLPQKVSPDGRLHGQFKQTGTVTGRFSSSTPNLQNIPHQAREMFTAPEGKILIGSDFSKVEPTILAHMTNDPKFKEPFEKGVDIYSSLASGTFNKPIEECGDGSKERKMMKTGLLATMYGTTMFTLSEQLEITVDEAEEFIQTFLNSYEVVAKWIESVHDKVDQEGFVETLFGRKRRFIGHQKVAHEFKVVEAKVVKVLGRKPKNIWSEKVPYEMKQEYWKVAKLYFRTSRQSVNAIIQGTGADIMKKALVSVHQLFEQWGEDYKVVATVHDEIIMEVPVTISQQRVEQVEEAMKHCVTLSLPLKVDTELMNRWGKGVKKDEWFV